MRWLSHPIDALMAARGILFPWVPVCLAVGIGLWFAAPQDPGALAYAGLALVVALGLAVRLWGDERLHPLAVALACMALGGLLAGARAHSVAAPVLSFRYYGPIEGRILVIDRSQSDHIRLTLDQVVLDGVAPDRTPERVRVSLHGEQGFVEPVPGLRVMLTGHLSAPQGPAEPGGFDFQRMAWFDRLGAVGYTRTPVLALAPPDPASQRINRLRARIAGAVQARIAGDPGAFAAALLTGDRSGIGQGALAALRASNLAHLLAISGLHMGLLTGFVFGVTRYGIALIPPLALRIPTKKIAAVTALLAAGFYLAVSGGNVATQRAFVMVAVMLGAVLWDRRALSLRSVAIAACIILALKPESLAEPGFQMSFAATTALVAGFGALRVGGAGRRAPRWLVPVYTLVLSSVLAGVATAPFGAAHFNRIAEHGLLGNLLTVPVMGTLVMPAAVMAGVLSPLGLEGAPLWVMEQGTRWILFIAQWVAGLKGALIPVPTPGPWVLPLLSLGALWIVLWRGGVRFAGVAGVVASLLIWMMDERPLALISEDGQLIGLQGPEGRTLSKPRGGGFAASSWLENDGDLAEQAEAAARPGFSGPKGQRRFALRGVPAIQLTGKGAAEAVPAACAAAQIVILAAILPKNEAAPPGCTLIDLAQLAQTGAIALRPGAQGGFTLTPTRAAVRLWSGGGPAARPRVLDVADRARSQ